LFIDLRHAGLAPTVLTYNILIDGYCRFGDLEGPSRFIEEMTDQVVGLMFLPVQFS
jgi:pentatricopeptide repeat protein